MPIPDRLNPTFAAQPAPPAAPADPLAQARDRLIVALDVPTAPAAAALAATLHGSVRWLKVGMELYTAAGPSVLEPLLDQGFSIFLDLKFYDIPNTVAGAVRSAAALGVHMLTLHASGGPAMLAAARQALAEQFPASQAAASQAPASQSRASDSSPSQASASQSPAARSSASPAAASQASASQSPAPAFSASPSQAAASPSSPAAPQPPRLLAVTVLTSMDQPQLSAIGLSRSPARQVELLARMGLAAGIDGFVCSPQEVATLRALAGPDAALVVPGIRPTGAAIGDQKRIATPADALRNGASHLVIGRPITAAKDPAAAALTILQEMSKAL